MASSPSQTLPGTQARRTGKLKKISLIPFVAVLYAYCAGGPFDYEAMVSTSGPGMALLFILIVPWLFSVPMALASAEMATAMPVEGGFYRWTRAAFGDFWGFQCGWWNWTGTFFMWASYGVVLADYVAQVTPVHSRLVHWAIAVIFLVLVAGLNILGIRVVGKLTLVLLLLQMLPVAAFIFLGFSHAHFNPFHPWMPPDRPWREVYGVGLALALWIYSGYEQLSTVIEEVEEPARNFPRGLAIVVPLAAVIYFLPMAAGLAALGNWQEWQTAYLVTAGRMLGGGSMGPAMVAGAALCSLLALGSVTQLIAIYAWMRSATSVLTLFSLWQLRRVAPEMKRSFVVPGGKAGLAAVVVIPTALFAWALINSDPASRLWGIACLALGPVAYYFGKRRQAATNPGAAPVNVAPRING